MLKLMAVVFLAARIVSAGTLSVAGFIDNGGTFTYLSYPTAIATTQFVGINNSGGAVVGYSYSLGVPVVYSRANFSVVSGPPSAGLPRAQLFASGIDDEGDIVGSYNLGAESYGFKISGEGFTTINFPGTIGATAISATNNDGALVGLYGVVPGGVEQGFLDNNGTFTTVTYPGARVTEPNGINDAGLIGRSCWLRAVRRWCLLQPSS